MRVLTKTYRWLRRRDAVRRDFCAAKHRLLSSMELTKEEKVLLGKISLEIHNADSMYYLDNGAFHYLSVGLSATHCIRQALCRAPAHGWDNHQDVYAFAMQLPNGGLERTP